jgi:biopolymer transport protein ExbD
MDLRKNLRFVSCFEVNLVPFIGVFFLIVIFFSMISVFSRTNVIGVDLPRAVTSDAVKNADITIVVTSENIIYIDGKVSTLSELKRLFLAKENKGRPVFIKADRRASIGRVADILNLGRSSGVERINIASEQES